MSYQSLSLQTTYLQTTYLQNTNIFKWYEIYNGM